MLRRRVAHLGLVLALLWTGRPAAAAPPAQGDGGPLTYQLTATWRAAPWRLKPGAFGQAADVSGSPDGRTLYVLDSRHLAVHVLARDGTARAAWALPSPGQLPGNGWS